MSSSTRRVQAALTAHGIDAQVTELPQSTRSASDAAAALGCAVAQIAKSLVFRRTDGGEPVLVIASGGNRVDEDTIARYLDARIDKADAELVRASTGFAIGGVPPLGHATPLETLVDEDLLDFGLVWAAAGTPRTVFPVAPRELAEVTGARVVRVTAVES